MNPLPLGMGSVKALTLQENILRLSDGGEGTVIAETAEEVSAIINTLKREGIEYILTDVSSL